MATKRSDGAQAAARKARSPVRWTKRLRATFLDHLAATCNVRASAAVIGVDPSSLYLLRRRDAAFADAWSEALALGYEMLETQLVGHALAGEKGTTLDSGVAPAAGPINVEVAMRLLTAHRASGKPRRGGPRAKVATAEETDRAILAKLAAIEARRTAASTANVAGQKA